MCAWRAVEASLLLAEEEEKTGDSSLPWARICGKSLLTGDVMAITLARTVRSPISSSPSSHALLIAL